MRVTKFQVPKYLPVVLGLGSLLAVFSELSNENQSSGTATSPNQTTPGQSRRALDGTPESFRFVNTSHKTRYLVVLGCDDALPPSPGPSAFVSNDPRLVKPHICHRSARQPWNRRNVDSMGDGACTIAAVSTPIIQTCREMLTGCCTRVTEPLAYLQIIAQLQYSAEKKT